MGNAQRALIIGNDKYPGASLRNCVNDANGLSQTVRRLGFDVQCRTNLNMNAMVSAANQFVESITRSAIVLFYFSGHGCQCNGVNYLMTTNADQPGESNIQNCALDAQTLIEVISKKRPKLLLFILDCCREYLLNRSNSASTSYGKSISLRSGPVPMRAAEIKTDYWNSASSVPTIIAFSCTERIQLQEITQIMVSMGHIHTT
ncbi:unnamed protein product [Rotaria socialis]|uniref:Caspase family p20 domain-containing protein n=1 Tax=Rotaria socialis TaxID=392032 RepID=A0A818FGG0_9BILA|nr:unnamed protein product [Rotaria socialis]CAF4627515.1 unnamed protein product [Rotaria socialis]